MRGMPNAQEDLPSRLAWATVEVVVNNQPVLYVPASMRGHELKRLLETVRGMRLRFDERRIRTERSDDMSFDLDRLDNDRVGEEAHVEYGSGDVYLWLTSEHWFPGRH